MRWPATQSPGEGNSLHSQSCTKPSPPAERRHVSHSVVHTAVTAAECFASVRCSKRGGPGRNAASGSSSCKAAACNWAPTLSRELLRLLLPERIAEFTGNPGRSPAGLLLFESVTFEIEFETPDLEGSREEERRRPNALSSCSGERGVCELRRPMVGVTLSRESLFCERLYCEMRKAAGEPAAPTLLLLLLRFVISFVPSSGAFMSDCSCCSCLRSCLNSPAFPETPRIEPESPVSARTRTIPDGPTGSAPPPSAPLAPPLFTPTLSGVSEELETRPTEVMGAIEGTERSVVGAEWLLRRPNPAAPRVDPTGGVSSRAVLIGVVLGLEWSER
mmetsp:Transcript_21355/g.54143  ORF Transcript_21355/g.54143 Transcript_21355/m.54143 type:complete len:332 (+) Transcript_21355:939-1934(+)